MIDVLHACQQQAQAQNTPNELFDNPPELRFEPEQKICPADGERLKVQKTSTRMVKTLGVGVLKVHQILLYCPAHPELGARHSENLAKLVPAHCNVAFDVIVEIGRLRFLENRQVREIETILWTKHGIDISPSEIESLIDRFIFYLAAVHQQSNELIKMQIEAQGGYILHLDSTCDGDSPKLASSIDSVSGFVLHSAKLNSENKDDIATFLETIKNRFGTPHAVVSDMSKAIKAATQQVFGSIAHYICHFHFLKASGLSLLEGEQAALYKALAKAGISGEMKSMVKNLAKRLETVFDLDIETVLSHPKELGKTTEATDLLAYYLVLWILDHASDGNGYGFPFDHRYLSFYERLQSAKRFLDEVKSYYPASTKNDKTIWKLFHLIKNVVADKALQRIVAQYKTKLTVFTDLRKAFGVAPEFVNNGLARVPVVSSNNELQKIRKAVKLFLVSLCKQIEETSDNLLQSSFEKVKERITDNAERLFAEPFIVDVDGEKRVFYVHRTNNIMERHFRQLNYAYRRVHGNRSVRRNLQNVPEQFPLVVNLKNPDYIKLIFDSRIKIAEQFSQIEAGTIRKMSAEHSKKKVNLCSTKTKRMLRKNSFKESLRKAFAAVAD